MIEIEKELNMTIPLSVHSVPSEYSFPLMSRLHEEPVDPYLTIFTKNEITRYCIDYAGNLVPVVFRLVPKYKGRRYRKQKKNWKLRIGDFCDCDLDFEEIN